MTAPNDPGTVFVTIGPQQIYDAQQESLKAMAEMNSSLKLLDQSVSTAHTSQLAVNTDIERRMRALERKIWAVAGASGAIASAIITAATRTTP